MRLRDVTGIVKNGTGKITGFLEAFRDFALRGSVIDMAVGIIIGSSFNEIVSSLVNDVIMPFLSVVMAGTSFSSYTITLRSAVKGEAGEIIKEPITLNIGSFFQNVLDFIIIAFSLFVIIQMVYKLREKMRQQEAAEQKKAEKKQENQTQLLREIRDLLQAQSQSQT